MSEVQQKHIYVLSEVVVNKSSEYHQSIGASLSYESAKQLAVSEMKKNEDIKRIYICMFSLDKLWNLDETGDDWMCTFFRDKGKIRFIQRGDSCY
jgi:hypothetical protein